MNTRRFPNPKNVRLTEEVDNRLEALAVRYSVRKSDLIRQALVLCVPKWEREGVVLMALEQA